MLCLGVRQDGSTPIVAGRMGDAVSIPTLRAHFAAFAQAGGFDIHYHGLRHSCAILMLSNGVDVRTAAARLGHDPAVLLKTYAHHVRSADDAAAATLEIALGN